MNKITAVVEKTDTGYSAYLPDIPGVATAADTFSDLRENIKEAISLYVETANEFKEEIPDILISKKESLTVQIDNIFFYI